jgi:hypothetical protein
MRSIKIVPLSEITNKLEDHLEPKYIIRYICDDVLSEILKYMENDDILKLSMLGYNERIKRIINYDPIERYDSFNAVKKIIHRFNNYNKYVCLAYTFIIILLIFIVLLLSYGIIKV